MLRVKRALFLAAALLISVSAFAQCPSGYVTSATCRYVDPKFTGFSSGTAAAPWTSIIQTRQPSGATLSTFPTVQLDTDLAAGTVTVFYPPQDYTNANVQMVDTVNPIDVYRTDLSTHLLTIDGISYYNQSAPGTPDVWAKYTGTLPYGFKVSTASPMSTVPGCPQTFGGVLGNCWATRDNVHMFGFDFSAVTGQILFLRSTTNWEIDHNHITAQATSTSGPGVNIGQANNGEIANNAQAPVACSSTQKICTWKGGVYPQHMNIHDNLIEKTFGEGTYLAGHGQFEDVPGVDGSTGDDIWIHDNTRTDAGAVGGQGDGIDTKEGNTNLVIEHESISHSANFVYGNWLTGTVANQGGQFCKTGACSGYTTQSAATVIDLSQPSCDLTGFTVNTKAVPAGTQLSFIGWNSSTVPSPTCPNIVTQSGKPAADILLVVGGSCNTLTGIGCAQFDLGHPDTATRGIVVESCKRIDRNFLYHLSATALQLTSAFTNNATARDGCQIYNNIFVVDYPGSSGPSLGGPTLGALQMASQSQGVGTNIAAGSGGYSNTPIGWYDLVCHSAAPTVLTSAIGGFTSGLTGSTLYLGVNASGTGWVAGNYTITFNSANQIALSGNACTSATSTGGVAVLTPTGVSTPAGSSIITGIPWSDPTTQSGCTNASIDITVSGSSPNTGTQTGAIVGYSNNGPDLNCIPGRIVTVNGGNHDAYGLIQTNSQPVLISGSGSGYVPTTLAANGTCTAGPTNPSGLGSLCATTTGGSGSGMQLIITTDFPKAVNDFKGVTLNGQGAAAAGVILSATIQQYDDGVSHYAPGDVLTIQGGCGCATITLNFFTNTHFWNNTVVSNQGTGALSTGGQTIGLDIQNNILDSEGSGFAAQYISPNLQSGTHTNNLYSKPSAGANGSIVQWTKVGGVGPIFNYAIGTGTGNLAITGFEPTATGVFVASPNLTNAIVPQWAPATAYTLNQQIVDLSNHIQQATTAGTSTAGWTNLVGTGGSPGSPNISSTTATFNAGMVNHPFQITGGGASWIIGTYNVAAFIDSQHITLGATPISATTGTITGGLAQAPPVFSITSGAVAEGPSGPQLVWTDQGARSYSQSNYAPCITPTCVGPQSQIVGVGTNLSASFTTDYFGNSRPNSAFTLGAIEPNGAAPPATTTTTVTVNTTPVVYGTAQTVTATILTGGSTPVTTGTVTFSDITTGVNYPGNSINASGQSILTGSLDVASHNIQATYLPLGNFQTSSGSVTVVVTPASITVTASNASVSFGQLPSYTQTYSGLMGSDTAAVIGGSPAFSSNATTSGGKPNVGTWVITPAAGTLNAQNYMFSTFVNGTLTVTSTAIKVGMPRFPSRDIRQ